MVCYPHLTTVPLDVANWRRKIGKFPPSTVHDNSHPKSFYWTFQFSAFIQISKVNILNINTVLESIEVKYLTQIIYLKHRILISEYLI